MKKAISGRQTGKTEKLIRLSANDNIPILVANLAAARHLQSRATKMGLHIPVPIAVHQLMSDGYMRGGSEISNIIVDDAEYVLKSILEYHKVRSIEAIAICTNDSSDELI